MITGRSDRDMHINVKKQLGKDGFMNTWQLLERGIILVIKKNPMKINIIDVVMIKGDEKKMEMELWKMEDRNYREYFHV